MDTLLITFNTYMMNKNLTVPYLAELSKTYLVVHRVIGVNLLKFSKLALHINENFKRSSIKIMYFNPQSLHFIEYLKYYVRIPLLYKEHQVNNCSSKY